MSVTLTHIRPISISNRITLTRLSNPVQAGYPTSVEELPEEGRLNLNQYIACNPMASFVMRVAGDSMQDARILDGFDIIVDRSREPREGDIVVASLDGEFTLKRLLKQGQRWCLQPENPDYPPIEIPEFAEAEVWGVVIGTLKLFYKR